VTITYGDGKTINETASVNVGANYLMATFPTAPAASTTKLIAHDGDATVWIRSMQIGTVTCTFDDNKGSIKIKQKH